MTDASSDTDASSRRRRDDGVDVPQAPVIAAVIATHNRVDLLEQLIADLETQEDVGAFEAVIVDDCSTDGTWDVLKGLEHRTRLALSVLRTPTNLGPAAARNLGWLNATAPLVAFTDDDCRPDRRWLAGLAEALAHADVVQGQTSVDSVAATGRGPFARVQIVEEWSQMFDCCNMGYRREILERVGGFDEAFRRPWGEDTDLGWRAVGSGGTTAWAPGALVWHRVETTGDRIQDWVLWMRDTRRKFYTPLLVKKHPEVRRRLHHRWFHKASHPPTLLALAGIGAVVTGPLRSRRWLTMATLCAPWVWHRSVTHRLPTRLRWLPVVLPLTFVGDVAEVATMLAGSVRYRVLLL